MKIIIAGGTGMIGQALAQRLVEKGNQVWVLSRRPGEETPPPGVQIERWDAKTSQGWGSLISEADAVINLAGTNIGARPWTNVRKQSIRESRIDAGRAIVEAIRESSPRPAVVLQIAGTGYYGNAGDAALNESAPAGQGFQASVVEDWERAIEPVIELGPRLVIMRTGVVLTKKGGVLAPFILQNRLFAGGPLGSGKQWISWIHIRDLISVFEFLIQRDDARGVFNVTAPEPLTNAAFGRTVSRVMHRPFWAPVPSLALKIVLGEMSALVLEGQRVLPQRLLDMGFQFQFDTVQKAVEDLIQ